MTDDTLRRANELKERIEELRIFIALAERDYALRIFRKPAIPYSHYDVSGKTKEKIIQFLKEENMELQKELDKL